MVIFRDEESTAYEQGYGTLDELAAEFRVSLGWAKKVSTAYARTGSMARPANKPGRKPRIGATEQALFRQWLHEQADTKKAERSRSRLCTFSCSRILRVRIHILNCFFHES